MSSPIEGSITIQTPCRTICPSDTGFRKRSRAPQTPAYRVHDPLRITADRGTRKTNLIGVQTFGNGAADLPAGDQREKTLWEEKAVELQRFDGIEIIRRSGRRAEQRR